MGSLLMDEITTTRTFSTTTCAISICLRKGLRPRWKSWMIGVSSPSPIYLIGHRCQLIMDHSWGQSRQSTRSSGRNLRTTESSCSKIVYRRLRPVADKKLPPSERVRCSPFSCTIVDECFFTYTAKGQRGVFNRALCFASRIQLYEHSVIPERTHLSLMHTFRLFPSLSASPLLYGGG